MDLQLKGRRALVTGASRGIGFATAQTLAREGCHVILVARAADSLKEAVRTLQTIEGASVESMAVDLGRPGAAEEVARAFPAIDILVNNAGDIPGGTLEQVTEERWRASWDVKVFGYINLSREYFSRMRVRSKPAVIVNIIGSAGEMLDATYIAGSVGNAALMAFTRSLGSTSVDHGIRVVGINPGPVGTDRIRKILRARAAQSLGSEDRWGELEAKYPMGRVATPDEIAFAVAMLASPRSGYTSGTVLTVDAGITFRRLIA
jgi:3-oxoacyl-[acyl-carrier protein] reductase